MAERWYRLAADEVLAKLNTSRRGLGWAEGERRLAQYGPNVIKKEERQRLWPLVLRQVSDVMTVILAAAAVVAWVTGDATDALMIAVVVVLNASLGFRQEYRAERALSALRKLEHPQVTVRRDGEAARVSSSDIVPGDIVVLAAGDRVPADGRLIEAAHVQVDESSLTGESTPVAKHVGALRAEDVPLGDRINLVFMGTTVLAGRARVVVTETGMAAELGRIAHLLQRVEVSKTPLQQRLAHLGTWLAVAVVFTTAGLFVAGVLRGEPLQLMLLTVVSLAVAVIPEGLPALVTIVLALGAQRMARRHALIRKLPAVETLGCVTTICSDKTGTLTQNIMSVGLVSVGARLFDVTGSGYRPEGRFTERGRDVDLLAEQGLRKLLLAAALCSDARLQREEEHWTILGDPTEGALLVAAAKAGLWKETLDAEYPREAEIPFDSDRKLMTTMHRDRHGRVWVFTKGSIEAVLRCSRSVTDGQTIEPLTRAHRDRLMRLNQDLASDGLRVLACAMRHLDVVPSSEDLAKAEDDLVFLGVFGLMDPPRPEARAAVARCREAGIRPVIITGDHRITAEAIAVNLGIKGPADRVLTGADLDALSEIELEALVPSVSVYARVSPEHKVKIVRALKRRGEIVAMTGDGVNDAPALRMADIGVAMGRSGTDVAREAADMVLLDDHFATIVAAVEEGRVIYDNIRKFTRYMLSTNSGEMLTVLFAMLLGLPLPLLPIQILWLNLVSDGLPALALGVEPPERAIMARPPRSPRESLFAGGLGSHILWTGVLMAAGTVAVFGWACRTQDLAHGRTMAFMTLTMFQMSHVLAIRSERDALWTIGPFSNSRLLGAVLLTIGLQLALTYNPVLQPIFHTTGLTGPALATCLAVAATVYVAVEIEKWWRYRRGGVSLVPTQ
ncbi:MAG: cation-translocating P-type ATPase [Nitrospirae bacterium]|nr:cation-translocating P-type ATPase [Nitrospirota bacterium]